MLCNRLRPHGNRLFYGDFTRLDLLQSAGVEKAKILVLAVDDVEQPFASSLEAVTDTLEHLGYTEGQALEITNLFRKHDEDMLLRSAEHMYGMEELQSLAKEGRLELEKLFEQDSKNPVSS